MIALGGMIRKRGADAAASGPARVDGGKTTWPIGPQNGDPTMPKITYIDTEGAMRTTEAEVGATVMETAINNDVPGILATCGGSCSCATCHVYVDEQWLGRLPPPELEESDMLDTAQYPKDNSRLSCQIVVTE